MKTSPSEPLGESRLPQHRPKPWAALAYRDYALLWWGMLISSIGFWMQFTALTYLVGVAFANSPAQSALNLGLLGAARCIPVILLAPVAGYCADRYPRRRTLIIANSTLAFSALALTYISTQRGTWALVLALVVAGIYGAGQAFDNPTRWSWVPFMVPRQLLSNAIGLGSFAGNAPLMVGPALAGVVISTAGLPLAFLAQAITQWAVVVALILMKPSPVMKREREPMMAQMLGGIRFIASHNVLLWIFVLLFATCLCVRPYTWLMAGFADNVLHTDARGYGLLLTIGGIGTLSGALTTAIFQVERRGRLWFISGMLTGSGLMLLGYVRNYDLVLVLLLIMGWGTMSFTSSSQVMIQTLTPENMRGRASSIFTMIMNGFVPGGTLLLGTFGSIFGLAAAFTAGGLVAVVLGVWVWVAHPAIRRA